MCHGWAFRSRCFLVPSAYTGCCHSVNWKLRDVCHIVSRAGIEPAFTRHRRCARQGRGSSGA
nr:MAG TPA: hypothetical protein [Caudoviricetes sp.]